jgi:Na+/phosphate symporter
LKVSAVLMPFAGICFLWFIGVVRDGFGRYEDRFFASVFLGSGLLFLAMMFVSSAVGAALVASRGVATDPAAHAELAAFGQTLLLSLSKTYAIRMGAVFMISLATIWLKTGLMPHWLIGTTYAMAVALLIAGDISMWLTLAFPAWVLVVSLLALARAGVIDLHFDDDEPTRRDAPT